MDGIPVPMRMSSCGLIASLSLMAQCDQKETVVTY